jgi:diadenosine tetraphosphate (Ap4A) HIT family hydrolase
MASEASKQSARPGDNPALLLRMRTGTAVFGDNQFLPGYCLLIHDTADHLTDLPRPERSAFLLDLSLLGEAIWDACGAADPALRRLNYSVLGNTWHHLHGHVHARYDWEPEPQRSGPAWLYGERLRDPAHAPGPAHEPLRRAIADRLRAVTTEAYAGS